MAKVREGLSSSRIRRRTPAKASRARFGKKIKALREQRKMGLREFARRAKLTSGYLSQLENGKAAPPGETKIIEIADVLGVDKDSLLADAERIAPDLRDIILRRPREIAALLRCLEHPTPARFRVFGRDNEDELEPHSKDRWPGFYNDLRTLCAVLNTFEGSSTQNKRKKT